MTPRWPAYAGDRRVIEDLLTHNIIGGAIEVHRQLGPGLLESAYKLCLVRELELRNLECSRQVRLATTDKGLELGCGYRMDLVVEDLVVVESKCLSAILPVHEAQLLTYLKLSGMRRGLLLNFNVAILRNGIKRMVL